VIYQDASLHSVRRVELSDMTGMDYPTIFSRSDPTPAIPSRVQPCRQNDVTEHPSAVASLAISFSSRTPRRTSSGSR
jgi:hypothetical protein